MVEHIFADNSRTRDTGLFGYPKLLLRLNEEFKEMGFKRIEIRPEIDKNIFKKDLTLIIRPSISGWATYSTELMYGTTEERYLYDLLKEKKGYTSSFSYVRLSESEQEPRKKIIFKYRAGVLRKNIVIGDYLYERNIILLYPDFFKSGLDLLFKNEVLFFFVNFLKEWIKKNKIKKVNVNAKIQELMFRQFRDNSVKRINELRSSTSNNYQTIKNSNEQIINMLKQNQDNKVLIEGLEKLVKTSIRELKKEIDKIKKLPFVKSVRLTSDGVNVEVKDVRITYEGKEIKMGDYLISILPNKFKISAKTPIVTDNGTFHHPHINGGDICFGNRREKINSLLAEMKFSKLVYFLYLYLKSYNHGDKYNPISYWIDGSDDGS